MILRIQCPSCERQFKVGDELMGRMVECGACEHRFRLEQAVVVPHREKFYPGDFKRPGLSGAARSPIDESAPVQFRAVEYQNKVSAADVTPLSPQRQVAIATGVLVIALGMTLFLVGSRPNGWLQDISLEKRLILASFMAASAGGLVFWGTRLKKSGLFFGVVLAAILITTAAMVPVLVTEKPGGTRVAEIEVPEQAVEDDPGGLGPDQGRVSSEEMMRKVGFGPIRRAVQAQTTADRDGRERVAAIWVDGMRERFKFQILKYLQRVLKTKERPSFYARRAGGLFVIEGIDENLEEVAEMASKFGEVEEFYPELRIFTMSLNVDRLVEATPELVSKLSDKSHPAFYVLNLGELNHIDIDRVREAAERLRDAEPIRFRREVVMRMTDLLEEGEDPEFLRVMAEALLVWSEPGDGSDIAVAHAINRLMRSGVEPPRSLITFMVVRESAAAGPIVESLWTQNPQRWESLMVDLGAEAEDAAVNQVDAEDRGLRYSAVSILTRVGTKKCLPKLREFATSAGEELRVKLEGAIASIEARAASSASEPAPTEEAVAPESGEELGEAASDGSGE